MHQIEVALLNDPDMFVRLASGTGGDRLTGWTRNTESILSTATDHVVVEIEIGRHRGDGHIEALGRFLLVADQQFALTDPAPEPMREPLYEGVEGH